MADPVFDDVALRRQLEGTTPEDYQRRSDEEHALFSLDFGLIPSMRIGHWLWGNGIGSTLVDMATDPIMLFGPELVMKAGSKIAGRLASEATAQGAKTLEEIYKAEPALKGLTAPMEATMDLGKTTERFQKWQAGPKIPPTPEELSIDFLRKMPRAVKGRDPVAGAELAQIGGQHQAERDWSKFGADQLEVNLRQGYTPEERALVHRAAQGLGPPHIEPPGGTVPRPRPGRPSSGGLPREGLPRGGPGASGPLAPASPPYASATAAPKPRPPLTEGDLADLAAERDAARVDSYKANWLAKGKLPPPNPGTLKNIALGADRRFAEQDIMGRLPPEGGGGVPPAAPSGPQPLGWWLPDRLKPLLDEYMMTMPEVGEYLHQNGLIRGVIENYASRAFRFKDQASQARGIDFLSKQVTGNLSGFTRHGLRRTIQDYRLYQKMEQMGLGKAVEDIAELWPAYWRSVGKAAADKRVLSQLAGYQWSDPTMEHAIPLVINSLSEVPRAAHELYQPVKNATVMAVAAERRILQGKPRAVWGSLKSEVQNLVQQSSRGIPVAPEKLAEQAQKVDDLMGNLLNQAQATHTNAWVLKQAYPELKRIWDVAAIGAETGPEKIGRGLLMLNAMAKRLNLGFTGFHLGALLGSASQALGGKFWRNPRALKAFGYENYVRGSDLVEDAIFHGLSVGAPIDAELEAARSGLGRAATWLEQKGLSVAAVPIRGFEHFQGKIDKYLWEYTQNGFKIATYNELLQAALKNPKFARLGVAEIKSQVAQHVNQAFGGLLWQRLFGSKQGLNALRMLMFAPDWTISNLLMATDVFSRVGKLVPGIRVRLKDLLAGDVRAYYARQYAFRARLQYALLGNLANYAFTSWKDGKGHFMDENAKGATNWIELPFNDKNGQPQFYRLGKHLTEMTEALRLLDVEQGGPLQYFRRKLAPIPAYVTTEVFGTDPLGRPLVGAKDGAFEELSKRLGHTAGVFEPMPIAVMRRFLTALAQDKGKQRPLPSALLSALGIPVRGKPNKYELRTRPLFR